MTVEPPGSPSQIICGACLAEGHIKFLRLALAYLTYDCPVHGAILSVQFVEMLGQI